MLIEVEIEASPNCSWDFTRIFDAKTAPRPVSRVYALQPNGQEALCEVTGWSSQGPCPAYAVVVEDSGDGQALLVFGGEEGVRLKPASTEEPFDLANPSQWGEPCLLLGIGTTMA